MKFLVIENTGWHIAPIAKFENRADAEFFVNQKNSEMPAHVKALFNYSIEECNND